MAAIATSIFSTGQALNNFHTADWREATSPLRETARRAKSEGARRWRMASPTRSGSPLSPGRAKAGKAGGGTTSLRDMIELLQGADMQGAKLITESSQTLVKSLSAAGVGKSGATSLSRWVLGSSLADGRGEHEVADSSPTKGTLKLPPPTSISGRPMAKSETSSEWLLKPAAPKATNPAPDDWSSSYVVKTPTGFTEMGKGLRQGARWTLGQSSSVPTLRPVPNGHRLTPLRPEDATGGGAERSLASAQSATGLLSTPDRRTTALEEDLGISAPLSPMRLVPVKHSKKLKRIDKRSGSSPASTATHSLRGMKAEIDSKLTSSLKLPGATGKPSELNAKQKAVTFMEQCTEEDAEQEDTDDWDEEDLPFFQYSCPAAVEEDKGAEEPSLEGMGAVECADEDFDPDDDECDDDLPFFELHIPQRPDRGRSISPARPDKTFASLEAHHLATPPRGTGCGFRCASWEWPTNGGDSVACHHASANEPSFHHEPVFAAVVQ